MDSTTPYWHTLPFQLFTFALIAGAVTCAIINVRLARALRQPVVFWAIVGYCLPILSTWALRQIPTQNPAPQPDAK